jgi:hypothetical protein
MMTAHLQIAKEERRAQSRLFATLLTGFFDLLWRDAEREGHASLFPRLDWPRAQRTKPRSL